MAGFRAMTVKDVWTRWVEAIGFLAMFHQLYLYISHLAACTTYRHRPSGRIKERWTFPERAGRNVDGQTRRGHQGIETRGSSRLLNRPKGAYHIHRYNAVEDQVGVLPVSGKELQE